MSQVLPLSVYAARLDARGGAVDGAAPVRGLCDDSRRVEPGDLFFARRGPDLDGTAFVADALERGAVAAVVEGDAAGVGPVLRVASVSRALAEAADLFFGRPQDDLRLVGVTGTKGKTTVAWLVARALREAGLRTAVLGTIRHDLDAGGLREAANTTPGLLELRGLLADARDAGCKAAVLEVSSHALDQGRTEGLAFDAAVFTNLGHDHLDYHADQEAYFRAKARLFEDLAPEAVAVLNREDPRWEALAATTRARVVTFGLHPEADRRVEDLALDLASTAFTYRGPDGILAAVRTPLVGAHNASNVAGAIAAAEALGVAPQVAAVGAAALEGVPGRLERVEGPGDLAAFVDYAHTDEALRRVLGFLREVGAHPLVCLVGCGGDRDTSKRPRMAASAAELADAVVLTSDNPRTEDPDRILADMAAGVPAEASKRVAIVPDRREAIRRAVFEAPAGATVLVAGKGHEKTQIVGGRRIPFDDVEEVREALVLRADRGVLDRATARSE